MPIASSARSATRTWARPASSLTDILLKAKKLDPATLKEQGFLGGLFGSVQARLERFKEEFQDVAGQIDRIGLQLDQHKDTLRRDIAILDDLHEQTKDSILKLDAYVQAGKDFVTRFRSTELPKLKATADAAAAASPGGGMLEAQAYQDSLQALDRLEKRVFYLQQARQLGIQQMPQIRIVQAGDDPNRSNSGFMFAGLVLSLLAGDVASAADLAQYGPQVQAIFRGMGLNSSSSGKLFDQFLAGGLGAEPMVVGYENQLVEWIIADPARWDRIGQSASAKPVLLYPHPTAYSAHPMITIAPESDRLLEVVLSPPMQELAWTNHGFRGPLGAATGTTSGPIAGLLPAEITAVLPIPSADVMLSLLQLLVT